MIVQDSGNRYTESLLAASLSRLEAEYGDPLAALEYVTLPIRKYHDSGNTTMMGTPLAVLAAFPTGSDATTSQPPSLVRLPWGHGDYGTSPNRSRCPKPLPSACITSFGPLRR